ncbi:MAG: D-alanyl-D-alanine carboxypeptidase family protein [Gammaproteobacteria bacterium]|nr:D-alanyl-D-alanine carboxypeptidase family protein [Gammaproteobacteria bacterium]
MAALSAQLLSLFEELGIPADYGVECDLPVREEPAELVSVGENIFGTEQRLTPDAAAAWQAMRESAAEDDVFIQLVSGYRSITRQAEIIRGKLEAGQTIPEILRVNAAPGFSEHHTGRALDLTTEGVRPLTDVFEVTEAFTWLRENAQTYGFSMSFPRDNRYGVHYEPWHWLYEPDAGQPA